MQGKNIFIIIAITLITASSIILHHVLKDYGNQIQKESYMRFQFLFGVHVYLLVSFLVFLKLENFNHQVICIFFIFFGVFVIIFIGEAIVHEQHGQVDLDEILIDEIQMTTIETVYSDIYYLIYMYSIMGITLTGMFIFVSEGMNCWHVVPINRYEGFLQSFEYNESLEEGECAICLDSFSKGLIFTSIKKCGHIFHQDCLKQWMKYNKICPLDRTTIAN